MQLSAATTIDEAPQLDVLLVPGGHVTDHFKSSQWGSNQNQPLRGGLFISNVLMLAMAFQFVPTTMPTAVGSVGLLNSPSLRRGLRLLEVEATRRESKLPAERVLHIEHLFARMRRLNAYEAKRTAMTTIGSSLSRVLPLTFRRE
jgi:hypothetical protein